MKKIVILAFISLVLTGCSVKKEGIVLGSSSKFSSIDIKKCKAKNCPEEIILVGTVSAYRSLGNDVEGEYDEYTKAAKKFLGEKSLTLTLGEFKNVVQGWTMLQTFNIPLIGASYTSIFISKENQEEINYVSTAEAMLVQGTGDLVSARSNADGLFFMERRLCDRKNEYSRCKKKYLRGGYDAQSGKQLNKDLTIKKNGKVINTRTDELLESH